jgi:hypothetical protein
MKRILAIALIALLAAPLSALALTPDDSEITFYVH